MKERIVTRNFICTFMAQLCLALVLYTMMSTVTEYAAGMGVAASLAGFAEYVGAQTLALSVDCAPMAEAGEAPEVEWNEGVIRIDVTRC